MTCPHPDYGIVPGPLYGSEVCTVCGKLFRNDRNDGPLGQVVTKVILKSQPGEELDTNDKRQVLKKLGLSEFKAEP